MGSLVVRKMKVSGSRIGSREARRVPKSLSPCRLMTDGVMEGWILKCTLISNFV